MKDVFLADFGYPCIAYVIRRLGIECNIAHLLSLNGERYTSSTVLKIADIIIWERAEGTETSDATLSIGKFGPVTTKLFLGRHFGVYEGHGLVSDTTFDGDTYFPRIRLMPLSECPVPQKFLRLDTLREASLKVVEEEACPKN